MLTISDISMLFQQCNIAFLSKNTECGQLFSILSNFSKVGLWWYFSFRKSEETPAGSQWGETIHLCALSESLQWSWSSAAAWTHSHWYSHDIQKHFTWRQHLFILKFTPKHDGHPAIVRLLLLFCRWEALRLCNLWQGLHPGQLTHCSCPPAHWREALCVWSLWQKVSAEMSSCCDKSLVFKLIYLNFTWDYPRWK